MIVLMFIKNDKWNILISITMLTLSCIALTIFTNFTTFIIFNAIYYSFGKIFENDTFSMRLDVIKFTEVENYKREHKFWYDLLANVGYLVGYLIILIFYKLIPSVNILTYLISGIGLLIIISGIFLSKGKQDFNKAIINFKRKQVKIKNHKKFLPKKILLATKLTNVVR